MTDRGTLPGALVRNAKAVAFSWHGVLFDRDRRAIHAAVAETLARWGVSVHVDELAATRGPTGRPQLERLLSIPRLAEAFRARNHRWVTDDDFAAMLRDLEPRLLAAAQAASEPNADACAALNSLHARGVRTAVICCTARRLLGPQLEALARSGVAVDCVVTADEACEPAPAPWGVFEAVQGLGLDSASDIVLVDDSPAGATAARNAGATGIALAVPGHAASPHAVATVRMLDELTRA